MNDRRFWLGIGLLWLGFVLRQILSDWSGWSYTYSSSWVQFTVSAGPAPIDFYYGISLIGILLMALSVSEPKLQEAPAA